MRQPHRRGDVDWPRDCRWTKGKSLLHCIPPDKHPGRIDFVVLIGQSASTNRCSCRAMRARVDPAVGSKGVTLATTEHVYITTHAREGVKPRTGGYPRIQSERKVHTSLYTRSIIEIQAHSRMRTVIATMLMIPWQDQHEVFGFL